MAVVAATMAAWWPARTISRIPTVSALSGRVPRPTSTQRTAVGALVACVLGVVAVRVGSDFGTTGPSGVQQAALVAGVLALTAALLLASPVLVRRLGRIAGVTPISCRLALRDLARHQSRSAAALAAVGLAMGIAAVIIVSTAAAEAESGIANLAEGQIVTRTDEHDVMIQSPDTEQLAAVESGVAEIVASIDAMVATRLLVVRDPASEPDGPVADPTLDVVRRVEPHWEHIANVYAATPELLDALDVGPDAVSGDDVVTAAGGELYLFGTPGDAIPERGQGRRLDRTGTLTPTHSALPAALVSPSVIAARGWETADAGRWLIARQEALTDDELGVARSIAARHGFVIESYDPGDDWTTLRLATGLVGMMLALGVLAATVGLMRADAAGEARTLTAAGATGAARRGVTAMTAGSLAALGGLLGIAAAYLGVAAGRIDGLHAVPWGALAVLGAGTPLVAAGAGWLLSGGEPPAVARRPLD
jgi:putative ABC transport system permease protein